MTTTLDGFDVRTVALPTPLVPVSAAVRERCMQVLAAALGGNTPEQVAAYLERGFPVVVDECLARPWEADEVGAFVDLLLCVQQSPAAASATG